MVYFIQAGEDGPIKIGYSANLNGVKGRLLSLQTGNHSKLTVLKAIKGGLSCERKMHRMFVNSRMRGEWFKPTSDLLDFIKRRDKNNLLKEQTFLMLYNHDALKSEMNVSNMTIQEIADYIVLLEKTYGQECRIKRVLKGEV